MMVCKFTSKEQKRPNAGIAKYLDFFILQANTLFYSFQAHVYLLSIEQAVYNGYMT